MAKIIYETNKGLKMTIDFDEQMILDMQAINVDMIHELCLALSSEVRAELQARTQKGPS